MELGFFYDFRDSLVAHSFEEGQTREYFVHAIHTAEFMFSLLINKISINNVHAQSSAILFYHISSK